MLKKAANKPVTSITSVIVTIVTLLCVALGAITLVQNCCKIVTTGANLIVLNNNAQYYNESARKTDAMTDSFNQERTERNKFYQSEDVVVRVFSNLPAVPKLLVWLLAIVLVPVIPCTVVLGTVKAILLERYFQKHMMRKQRKAQKIAKQQETSRSVTSSKQSALEIENAPMRWT